MASGASFPCVRSLGKIFLYLLLVLVIGALAAPVAWHLIQMIPAEWSHGFMGKVQGMPFHRYLSRSLQVTAIVLLWPLLRSLRIRSLGELGLHGSERPLGDLSIGMLAGLFCIILLESASLWSGAFTPFPWWKANLIVTLPQALLTAIVVATIEEFLFRGVLLGFLRQMTAPGVAILLSAVIFAGVHFLNLPADSTAKTAPEWCSGFAMIGSIGGAMPPWPVLGWAFATLLAAGLILAWMTVRTGSLMASIGLHGCWILGQQAFNRSAYFIVQPPEAFLPFFGAPQCNGMVPVGLIPLASLLIAGLLVGILLRYRAMPPIYPLGAR